MKPTRKPKPNHTPNKADVAQLARAIAASFLVHPTLQTQGDVDAFWEQRSAADRDYYERRASALRRILMLPPGEAGPYMQPARKRRTS